MPGFVCRENVGLSNSNGTVPLVHPPGAYWGRDTRTPRAPTQHIGVGGRAAATSVASAAPPPSPSLDLRAYVSPDAPVPDGAGEWHVQQTFVAGDPYCEFFAVEDFDGQLLRHFRQRKKTSLSVDSRSLEDVEAHRVEKQRASGRRASKNCKWKIRMLGADHMFTLNTRGGIRTYADAWALWGQFERYCSRRFRNFKCVVVLERHGGGGPNHGTFHIHFAVQGFLPVQSMRLWWHRILTGRALRHPLPDAESPGNIDAKWFPARAKLQRYLAKYLTKTFAEELAEPSRRVKRFASSKGIGEPERVRSRMSARCGEHAYRLRCLAESAGFAVEGFFEGSIAGRAFIWMQCRPMRAAARSPEGSSIRFPDSLAKTQGGGYS